MLFDEKLYEYSNQNSSDLPDYLNDLLRETALTTVNPFMACGPVMGRFLTQISKWIQPRAILEIGSFTGYSALSLAQGLAVNGSITCIEVNEEYENIILKYFEKAGMTHLLQLIIGDALHVINNLHKEYDLIFIDANKQHNEILYEMILPLLSPKGILLIDNTLWYGNVLAQNQDKETQAIHRLNSKLKKDRRINTFLLPLRDGITLITKK